MCCLLKPSGNMPAGQARPQRTRGEMILILPVPIITGMVHIIPEVILNKLAMWGSMRPTHGAFLTCTEMCGSGSTTGRQIILPVPRPILRVRHRARIGSYGVVPGAATGRTCVQLGAPPTPPSLRGYGVGFRVGFQAIQPDGANPELELFGGASVTREAGQAWAEPGAAGHDARDGNLTASITITGTVDMNTTGTYILTYSVADAAGNEANATRTVTVVDTTNPVLTLLGDANMSQAKDSAWVDPGATASDSLDGNLTSSITVTGTVDVNTTGVYTLTYSVSDGASNETNATRVVNVGQASTHNADLNASVQLQMLWVEPGTFTMGQSEISSAAPVHDVTLSKGFYLGKYEVTQAQYEAVMTGNTDSLSATPSTRYNGNANRPVETVSWDDIQIFLSRLNAQQSANIPAGWSYVLPTEAEWEYACRAGTTTTYSWGDTIATSNANYSSSGLSQTSDAGNYASNPWGFFDMHGNVWEWTADLYGSYSSGAQTDPTGAASGSYRVFRGGSWLVTGTRPCVRPTAASPPPSSAVRTSASVSVSNSSELGTEG